MKKKTTLTKMHIAPSTVRYDAVAARDSNEVGLILAAVRKRNGYSLVTFSELLRHYGVDVSDKGISKWEKGYTTPSIYQLVAICHALNIKEGPSYFTKTFQKPALLNAIGQKKVAEYEMDLIASRRYQPGTEEPAKIDCIMMPVSELPVSAGLGAFLEGEMFQQIQVPASSVPAGAEFGIYVSGDSMETVVLLSKGEVDSKKIRVEFSLEDMDMSEFQDGATYPQIKEYVLEHTGLKVSNLYISQIKRKCGIGVGKNYNLPKSEDSRQPQCPPEKEKAIREAFKYFGII